MSEVTEKYRQDEYYGEVYSLELDVNDFGVYIVNGMLAIAVQVLARMAQLIHVQTTVVIHV